MEQVTVASSAYLERHGVPASLDDLDDLDHHFAVDYISSATARPTTLDFRVRTEVVERQLKAKVSVTGADLYTGAAVSGLGLVQVPRHRIEKELAANLLRIVLPLNAPPSMPVSVLYPHNRQLSARVRVFAQWLAQRFDGHCDSNISQG